MTTTSAQGTAGAPLQGPAGPRPRSARARWVLVLLLVLAGAGFALWRGRSGSKAAAPAGSAGAQGPAAGGPGGATQRPVSVAVARVARRNVPVYRQGLGTAAAASTVTVKSQVDGRLDQVLFREGQAVRRGQVLALIDARPFEIQLRQAEGALARDQAQLVNARLTVARDRQLLAEKLIAQQQLDTDAAAAGQLEGTVQVDQAAIATARLNLEYTKIASPIDGVTGLRQVDAGNLVHATDTGGIVIVTQLDPIAVVFTLPQDDLPAIQREMAKAPLPVEVLGRDGASLLGQGELGLIDNQINQATSTLRLKAVVPNPQRAIWPNAFVNVRLRLSVERGALVVPATALQRGPSGTYVYVVDDAGSANTRPVQVALVQGDLAILAGGVAEGDQVVTDGQNALRPGSKVAARPAAGDGQARRAPGAAP